MIGIDLMVFNTLKERWIQNNTIKGLNSGSHSHNNKWSSHNNSKSNEVGEQTPDVLTLVSYSILSQVRREPLRGEDISRDCFN